MTAFKLAAREVVAPGARPERWMAMLHGLLGRGRNWGSLARAVVAARPEWGVLLVDLRLHGDSLGAPPPHDIAHAAADVRALDDARPLGAVLGHSFGGKVALALAADPPANLLQAWIVDASPSKNAREGESRRVLEILRGLRTTFPSREEAVAAFRGAHLDETVARWLATNLVGEAGGLALPWDLDAVGALLADYFAQDLWRAVESRRVHDLFVLKATRESALSTGDFSRLAEIAARDPHVHAEEIDGGHWLHVDAPAAILGRLVTELPR